MWGRGLFFVKVRFFSNEQALHGTVRGLDESRLRPFLDFTKPSSWYPAARSMKRRIICHVGPTNSGKTYAALQELAKSPGPKIYCAPLRLLAIEMYERLNKQWKLPCSLRTGEITCGPSESVDQAEYLTANSSTLSLAPATSCTVEMVDIGSKYDTAIIDEIQMMADPQRGWAFTQALLGLQSDTVFLCGEEAAVPLVEKICKETGDTLEVRHFRRLSPLTISSKSLGDYKNVEPGDCVVTFSRRQIFDVKAQIERATNKKCAVVYGTLPMESRSQQAKLFNEAGSDYNVLVASDAIGMGLNLNIKRVIFQTLTKFNGIEREPISANQAKQIAGRAGRFGTDHEAGLATTLMRKDLPGLQRSMRLANESIATAGLLPSSDHVVNMASAFPQLNLPSIIDVYRTEADLGSDYFLCHFKNIHRLAVILESYKKLSIRDRFQLACAPVKVDDEFNLSTFRSLVHTYSQGKPVPFRIMIPKLTMNAEGSLKAAESVYRSLDLYLWLATHFPERFMQIKEARQKREECGQVVGRALEMICHIRGHKKQAKAILNEETQRVGVEELAVADLEDIDQIINQVDKQNNEPQE